MWGTDRFLSYRMVAGQATLRKEVVHAACHGIRASTLVERPPATNDVPTKDRLLGRLTDGQTGCVMAIRKHRQKNDHPNPFIFIKPQASYREG